MWRSRHPSADARDLGGRVALVTGASGGIGRQTALRLGALGATVVGVGRDERALADLEARVGGTHVVADLAGAGAVPDVVARAMEATGRVDILVNNAGVGWAGDLASLQPAALEQMMRVNLVAAVGLAAAVVPGMLRAGRGHIVNVASIVGFTGSREEAAYSATKAGLVGFSRSLRQELAGTGVCVSLIVPGVVDTPFFAARGKAYDRRWPHPLPADRVAAAIVAAILADRAEAFVPRWMRIAALLAGTAPRLYERLAVRFS